MSTRRTARMIMALLLCATATAVAAQDLNPTVVTQQLSPGVRKTLQSYRPAAENGDYQAMRNYAFAWATDAAKEIPDGMAIGCAWYGAILDIHKSKINAGDTSNRDLYCGRLNVKQALEANTLLFRIKTYLNSDKSAKTTWRQNWRW